MNHACREAQELLAVGAPPPSADPQVAGRVAAHVARCAACRDEAAEQRRLIAALGAGGAGGAGEIDELTRARWLQAMAPQIDELATRHARRRTGAVAGWRAWALAPILVAALALVAWAVRGRSQPASPPVAPLAAAPSAIPAGVIAHLVLDGDPGTRIAVVGPARVAMTTVVDLDGIALVDAGGARALHLRGPGLDVRAQRARFAAAFDGSGAIFVADGEVEVDGVTLTAGTWRGPLDRRATLAAALDATLPPAPPAADPTATAAAAALPTPAPTPPPPAIAASRPRPTPPPTADVPTAASLYAAAERALAAGDRATAASLLRELVARFPAARQAPSAMYDLATLARRDRDLDGARGWLDRLLAGAPPAALREPASYLRCRVDVDAADTTAARACFTRFQSDFPDSAHAAEVRTWLGAAP